ncbi:response regulator [Flavobacterium granuli]|uniref:CheY-like chemotaxis protein n=1 Tax=Flavobacterium granuli TaxID=280093 RepID=A0ABU1S4T5_9FLAO|nr:response regulator [Flavobacterium granuli]MDR6845640.1 CheY-like chemotaxis protein [Flavobacterium granuli]
MEKKLDCILLVDDDFATNFINKRIIQKINITEHIQVTLNGKEAIDYLSKQGKFESAVNEFPLPQLILLDINMPVMDGWEFIQAYKSLDLENKDDIVVVMLSSSFNPADKAKAESIAEIADFKQKPISKEALIEIIETYFPKLVKQVFSEKV